MNETHCTSVEEIAEQALERALQLWWQLESGLDDELQRYSLQERLARGRHLERLVDQLVGEIVDPPTSPVAFVALRQRLTSGLASLGRSGLGWDEDQVALLTDPALAECLATFGRKARAFDPSISLSALYQAGRNVAVMNGVQMLLGLPVELTPAIVGYSLLYPYSDNYLDDPAVSLGEKHNFGERFAQWIAGHDTAPANGTEEQIRSLVAMIEEDLPAADYPLVWQSLSLILQAQNDSVQLVNEDASPYEIDVLRLTMAKGGASVLADGYLVAAAHGGLDAVTAEALYGFGVCLQLVDDMQDVQEDMADGVQTIFSQTAVTWPLDGVASRAMRLASALFEAMTESLEDQVGSVVRLMQSSVHLLMIDAIAETRRLYSRPYVLAVEDRSPLPFQALTRARRRLARNRVQLLALVEGMIRH